jgi:hypothetical protein
MELLSDPNGDLRIVADGGSTDGVTCYRCGKVGGMAVGLAVSVEECGAMVAALISRTEATREPRAAGALASLSWLSGMTDTRPMHRDVQPATWLTLGPEMDLAGRVERGEENSTVPPAYAAGVLDAAL